MQADTATFAIFLAVQVILPSGNAILLAKPHFSYSSIGGIKLFFHKNALQKTYFTIVNRTLHYIVLHFYFNKKNFHLTCIN
ncbi:hypothetical protein T4B_12999 [Trichinella pseudospiralis]|uniref:Uncharacterized protein n=1 Tax=Trichinella pseudospiralis TaxID=6337 RepID=A0A0V1KCF9_TRIPS|nr:hypothetical protein T4B_12999 [Trichinella pseudospiralis]KRZ44959.1 hypothetical protein T4C_12059 [Trichinella pseudospiralis]